MIIENQSIQPKQLHQADKRKRQCTDVFWIITFVGFVVAMIIYQALVHNQQTLKLIRSPTNSDGNNCSSTYHDPHPYILVINPQVRVCVSQCPQQTYKDPKTKTTINCSPKNLCDKYEWQINQASTFLNIQLGICVSNQKYNDIRKNPSLAKKIQFTYMFKNIIRGIIGAYILGLIYWIIIQKFPKTMMIANFAGSLIILILGLGFIRYWMVTKSTDKIILHLMFIGVIILLVILLALWIKQFDKSSKSIALLSYMINNCGFPIYKMMLFSFIIALSVFGIVFLMVLQYLSIASDKKPVLYHQEIYYQLPGISVAEIIALIQVFWVFNFIQELYKYVISGFVVNCYFQQNNGLSIPIKLLKNIGSVARSSFIQTFFIVPLTILSVCKPNQKNQEHARTCYCLCGFLFNTAKEYSNNPYASMYYYGNGHYYSALHTKYLYHNNYKADENSSYYLFNFSGKAFLTSLCILIFVFIQLTWFKELGILTAIAAGFIVQQISIYFVTLHVVSSQNLELCYLIENELMNKETTNIKNEQLKLILNPPKKKKKRQSKQSKQSKQLKQSKLSKQLQEQK